MPVPLPNVHFINEDKSHWCCLLPLFRGGADSFISRPSAFSLRHRDEEWYEADKEKYVFTRMLLSNQRSCHESVAVSGSGSGDKDPDENSRG